MNELEMIKLEMRSWLEKAQKKEVDATTAKAEIEKLQAKKMELEQRAAQPAVDVVADAKTAWSEVRSALMEKRSITQNGAGAVNVVSDIIRAIVDGNKLAGLVSKFGGPNASTVIPVLSPHLAKPAGRAEGVTGVSADSTAVLSPKTLQPKPYVSVLPVSRLALMSTSFDRDLPAIFAEAFAGAVDEQILVGSGTGNNGLGVFVADNNGVPTSQDITTGTVSGIKTADLVTLAVKVNAVMAGAAGKAIVMHPDVFATILADATAGTDPIKYQLLNMQVMGIPIILSTYAPNTIAGNQYVAVGGDFSKYAWAYANELTIDKVVTIGSDNITVQAIQYMNFAPIIKDRFYRLKVKNS